MGPNKANEGEKSKAKAMRTTELNNYKEDMHFYCF